MANIIKFLLGMLITYILFLCVYKYIGFEVAIIGLLTLIYYKDVEID